MLRDEREGNGEAYAGYWQKGMIPAGLWALKFFQEPSRDARLCQIDTQSKLGLAADCGLIPGFDKIIRHIRGFGITPPMPHSV
jgi:hypothetical protein